MVAPLLLISSCKLNANSWLCEFRRELTDKCLHRDRLCSLALSKSKQRTDNPIAQHLDIIFVAMLPRCELYHSTSPTNNISFHSGEKRGEKKSWKKSRVVFAADICLFLQIWFCGETFRWKMSYFDLFILQLPSHVFSCALAIMTSASWWMFVDARYK